MYRKLASVEGAVIQATGRTKLEDGLCAGGQLKARNGLQRVRTIPWNDRIPPYRGRCGPRPPRGQTQFEYAEARGAAGIQLKGPGFASPREAGLCLYRT